MVIFKSNLDLLEQKWAWKPKNFLGSLEGTTLARSAHVVTAHQRVGQAIQELGSSSPHFLAMGLDDHPVVRVVDLHVDGAYSVTVDLAGEFLVVSQVLELEVDCVIREHFVEKHLVEFLTTRLQFHLLGDLRPLAMSVVTWGLHG
jgi:hypothetical protein